MQSLSRAQKAMSLAAAGEAAAALDLLVAGVTEGEAECAFVLGLWRLEGRFLPRDPAAARDDLRRAAEAGHQAAARIHAGFVANGTGGPPDWPQAMALLASSAPTDPVAERQLRLLDALPLTPDGRPKSLPERRPLSDAPEIAAIPGLFSAEECRFLIDMAGPRFRPATIFHEGKQRFVEDPVRNSDAASFPLVFEWPLVHALNMRIAAATGTEVAQGETLQILRYGPGQQYRPHFDAVRGLPNQRELTLLVYLNDDYEGGETHFPEPEIAFRGAAGDALMFRNCGPDGRPDPASRHAGLPVRQGVKLIASRWIRQRPPEDPVQGFGRHEAEGKKE
jgi:prolyl 4-hydroxylase